MTRLDTALAEIARCRELARAATPGPWDPDVPSSNSEFSRVWRGPKVVARTPEPADTRHFVVNADPAHVLAVLDAAEATVRRHVPSTGSPFWPYDGKSCTYCGEASADPPPWPCPDAAAVLDLYAPEDLLEQNR